MNWKAIKHIYRCVLIHNRKIEYLGEDKYRLISFYTTGQKRRKAEYKNGEPHGKCIGWHKNGNKYYEAEYKDGKQIKMSWRR